MGNIEPATVGNVHERGAQSLRLSAHFIMGSYVLAAGEGGRRGAFSHRKFCDFSLDGKTHKSEDFSQHDLSLQNLWGTN